MLHPVLLLGAALIGVPILLHLIMRQEPKRVPFPAFRFLKLRSRTNQRKMRLRHWILLALRMALIALIALTLFQPTLLSERFNLHGDRPIAAILIIDSSPSMGYVLGDRASLSEARQRGLKLLEEPAQGPWTALDEARARALELLEDLPLNSKIVVINTDDNDARWPSSGTGDSLEKARKKIRDLKKPRGNSLQVTRALERAYNLFYRSDEDLELGQEGMPRLLCIFSDRTVPSWDSGRVEDLKIQRDKIPPPAISTVYVDVGVDKPVNMSITSVDMQSQLIPAGSSAFFTVYVDAYGGTNELENILEIHFPGEKESEVIRQPIKVKPGEPARQYTFHKDNLPPGLHQLEIKLLSSDSLPFDDVRYLTFRVREPKKVLLVADPGKGLWDSLAPRTSLRWRNRVMTLGLEATGWYTCDVIPAPDMLSGDDKMRQTRLSGYEAVVLFELVDPAPKLWEDLLHYGHNGGQIMVVPGGKELVIDDKPAGYNTREAREVLPAALKDLVFPQEVPEGGVSWPWNDLKDHPLLAHFKQWFKDKENFGKYDLVLNPPRTWGYWKVDLNKGERLPVVVHYTDPDQTPALLERNLGPRGKILLFTTPLDGRSEPQPNAEALRWNDYPSTSFFVVLMTDALRYLTGETEDRVYNFTTGHYVVLRWPLDAESRSKTYFLNGPDVNGDNSTITREHDEPFLRLGPDRLSSAGNYIVASRQTEPGKGPPLWEEGFGLNIPVEESNLERLPVDTLEELLGPGSVAPVGRNLKLQDVLSGKFGQPIELFPFLLILLLLFMAFENLLSNRFYRKPQVKG